MAITIEPGLVLYSRKEWGADIGIPRLGYSVARSKRTEAIIHHTVIIDNDATPNRWETLAEVFAKMRQLQKIRPNLGLDVPYNFVAFHMADGSLIICEGRGLDRTGAHTYGHNTKGMATAGQGNFQKGLTVSPYTGHWSRWWGYQKYDMGMENLGSSHPTGRIAYGHKDLSSTACPGDKLYAVIPQLTFAQQEENDMLRFVKIAGSATVYATDGIFYWTVRDGRHLQELIDVGLAKEGSATISEGLFNRLRESHGPSEVGGGDGLTQEELIEAVKEGHRQGTG